MTKEKANKPRAALVRQLVSSAILGFALAVTTVLPDAAASAAQKVERGSSGLPLPRFVSLKSGRVNMRVGPGLNYAVDWLYLKEGLPMEIIHEYGNWRQVRDAQGAEGWINQALLSGQRTGLAAPWFKGKDAPISLLAEPADGARAVARVEPGAIGTIKACNGKWCEMKFSGYTGWIDQTLVWGAYPDESIED